jgi:Outer membrane protein beta-barrel domain
MRLLSRSLAFAVLLAGAILPNVSQSQVVPAIKGGGSQINIYGLYSLVNPDGKGALDYPPGTSFPASVVNSVGSWNQGGSVGADFRLGRFIFGQPALGVRYTISTGNFGKESTYVFGPELHYAFGRFRPYGNVLLGVGDVTYHGTNFEDNSIVYQFGGGVDYHVNRRLSLRLVDFQYQLWNLGTHEYPAGFLPGQPAVSIDTKLQPYSLNFGIVFRVF